MKIRYFARAVTQPQSAIANIRNSTVIRIDDCLFFPCCLHFRKIQIVVFCVLAVAGVLLCILHFGVLICFFHVDHIIH